MKYFMLIGTIAAIVNIILAAIDRNFLAGTGWIVAACSMVLETAKHWVKP